MPTKKKSSKNYPFDVVNGDWIKKKIEEKGLTRKEVYTYMGISEQTLSKYLNDKKGMSNLRKSAFYYFLYNENSNTNIKDLNNVNPNWLSNYIDSLNITRSEFGWYFGNQSQEISAFCSGRKPISQVRKVAFWNFFYSMNNNFNFLLN